VDCPKCGTWNPDDKTRCWRCSEELPKPKPAPDKKRRGVPMTWIWIAIGVMVALMILQTCMAFQSLP
jgi:predicted nucleic acid-binding Zn ribbon protein